jgi:glucose-6-phosphate 1-dehydrogenase
MARALLAARERARTRPRPLLARDDEEAVGYFDRSAAVDVGGTTILEGHRANASGPEPIDLEMQFADQGGEGPTPYEVLFHAALSDDHRFYTRQDTIEQTWRIIQPLLDHPPRNRPYRGGSWGAAAARELPKHDGGWRWPWTPSG